MERASYVLSFRMLIFDISLCENSINQSINHNPTHNKLQYFNVFCVLNYKSLLRMTGPDCAVMCNLINTHTHIRGFRSKYH